MAITTAPTPRDAGPIRAGHRALRRTLAGRADRAAPLATASGAPNPLLVADVLGWAGQPELVAWPVVRRCERRRPPYAAASPALLCALPDRDEPRRAGATPRAHLPHRAVAAERRGPSLRYRGGESPLLRRRS